MVRGGQQPLNSRLQAIWTGVGGRRLFQQLHRMLVESRVGERRAHRQEARGNHHGIGRRAPANLASKSRLQFPSVWRLGPQIVEPHILMRVPEFRLEGDALLAMQNASALHRMMNIMRETGKPHA